MKAAEMVALECLTSVHELSCAGNAWTSTCRNLHNSQLQFSSFAQNAGTPLTHSIPEAAHGMSGLDDVRHHLCNMQCQPAYPGAGRLAAQSYLGDHGEVEYALLKTHGEQEKLIMDRQEDGASPRRMLHIPWGHFHTTSWMPGRFEVRGADGSPVDGAAVH